MVQFDLGDHQAGVVAEEFVDLPQVAGALDVVPPLLDDAADAQRKQRAAFGQRDRVVELLAARPGLARLDVQVGGDIDADYLAYPNG